MTKDNSESKEDLIIDMLLTLCGRNLEISFAETLEFQRRYEKLNNLGRKTGDK